MSTQSELIFNRLIISASEQKASDLFLFPGQIPFIKKEGELMTLVGEQIITSSFIEEILLNLLNPSQQEKFKKHQQIIFSGLINKDQRAKINVFRQKGLSTISIKLIPNRIPSLESLKLPKVITDFTLLNRGLIIISGPKDSGRSTLLASMIDYINRNFSKHIATLEQPIEYLFVGGKGLVEQREIGSDVFSFEEGLESIENRNVDVLVVSEVKNPSVFLEMLKIAQKGTLVFGIMDINSVFNVLKQTIESFESEKQALVKLLWGENFGGIICTRLISRIGGGRILALEILNGSPVAKNLIKEGKIYQINNLLQVAEKELSISLDRFLAALFQSGEITLDEALKNCLDENNLRALIGR